MSYGQLTHNYVAFKEQQYLNIFQTLLMSGEYREQDIDAQVHEIMDNPHIYPEYFN